MSLEFALFFFAPCMDRFITRPAIGEEDEHEDDGCPDLEEKDLENEGDVQEPEKTKVRPKYESKTTPIIKGRAVSSWYI